jgi:phosphoserine phosphatase RsbX
VTWRSPDVSSAYEWGVAGQAHHGERRSGDLGLVVPRADGTLTAVVDALGHGDEAADAAEAAVACISSHADDDLDAIVRRCHDTLRNTRGAVVALAVARDDGTLTWTGVGNVEAVLVRKDAPSAPRHEHALRLGGVLGMQVPRVRPSRAELAPGDVLVFATDGVGKDFLDRLNAAPAQRMADGILRRHATGRDDALVLVGRFVGGGT